MKALDRFRMVGIIVALAASLALAGCSAVKLGYTTLPELAYWWLDGYADFGDEQRTQVRADLARLQAWHRRNELPRLADLLADLEARLPGEITPQQACGFLHAFEARADALAQEAEPAVVALATSLDAQQQVHIERKFRSRNESFRKDWIDPVPAQQQQKRFEQLLDRFETLYGRLDEPQRAVLREGVARSAYDAARILADRRRRQQDLLQVLGRVTAPDASPELARTELRGWLERARHAPDAEDRAWQEGLVQEGCGLFSAVHASTTPAQREQAARRLRGWQRDLRELAQAR
jgi:hypothetical protein